MKITSIVFCLLSGLLINAGTPFNSPEAQISNGLINARLYLPDADDGYYRGSRFDWSGVIASLDYKRHHYFGQWFKEYVPTLHDAIVGPVESFDPIGYEEAKIGANFIKVGIGALSKTDESPYAFAKTYPIINAGIWHVITKPDQVQFTHSFHEKAYSYEYKKTVKLIKNKPEMILAHTLKNTGQLTLETSVYNHNFFVMDDQPTGPGFTVTFPFALPGEVGNEMGDFVQFRDHQMSFLKELDPKEHVFFRDMTAGKNADYHIQIENHKTGAAVKITCDQPISKFIFWSASTTLCPEPFIKIKVDPGKEFSWNITYEFYDCGVGVIRLNTAHSPMKCHPSPAEAAAKAGRALTRDPVEINAEKNP